MAGIGKRLILPVAVLAAAGLGYALARFTAPAPEPPAPVEREAASSAGTLTLPDAYLELMGIEVQSVVAGDLSGEVQAAAVVSAAPNGLAIVTARAPGTVTRLDKRLGDDVAAGEMLAIVESREAGAMAAARSTAESKVALARSILQREQGLYDQRITPRQDLETAQAELAVAEAEAARARAAATAAGVTADGKSLALTSPMAGRVTSARAALGAYVEPDTELFRVADVRFVVIEAAVPALDARRIAIGDRAEISTSSGTSLRAVVSSVTPTVDTQTRSATITLSLDPDQQLPAPGEFVQARIATRSVAASGFIVPDDAVQTVDGRTVVFVRRGDELRVTPVVVAARGGGRASVLSGIQAGDRIATKNAFLLKAELEKSAEEEE
jgi:cobalt-zinc-cadmium efflux system membrane fusion protein